MPMIAMPGIPELVIIALVVVLLFGAKKLPALGGAVGESIKNFKKGVGEHKKSLEEDTKDDHQDKKQDKKQD